MPDKNSKTKYNPIPVGSQVVTPDGDGEVVDVCFRKNTNGGPGTRQYVVRLADNRIHRYSRNKVQEKS